MTLPTNVYRGSLINCELRPTREARSVYMSLKFKTYYYGIYLYYNQKMPQYDQPPEIKKQLSLQLVRLLNKLGENTTYEQLTDETFIAQFDLDDYCERIVKRGLVFYLNVKELNESGFLTNKIISIHTVHLNPG